MNAKANQIHITASKIFGNNMRVVQSYFGLHSFPEDVDTIKLKLFYGQLVATTHSLPDKRPCALLPASAH
jgi:hypothetical protein